MPKGSTIQIAHKQHIIIFIVVIAVMALHFLEFPHYSYNVAHDSSSSATFAYYAAKNVQFGTELYQNIGPFGYVHYSYDYVGYLHWQKIIFKTFSRLVLVFLAAWMMTRLRGTTAKILCFISLFAYYSFGGVTPNDYQDLQDNIVYLTIYLLALWLLQNRNDRLFHITCMAGWYFLAFISLNKNIFFVLSCFIVTTVVAQNLSRHRMPKAIGDAVSFTAALGINWMLAGQQLDNLPNFVHGILSFSSGYNEAMALPAPLLPLLLGIAVLAFSSTEIFMRWRLNWREFGRASIECFLLFIIWKHGFVRADEHMLIFFYAALSFAVPLFFYSDYPPPITSVVEPSDSKAHWLKIGRFAVVHLLSLISFYTIIHNCHYKPERLWNHLKHNGSWLLSLRAKTHEMDDELTGMKQKYSLPRIRRVVQNESIDFFGYEPGYLLLNELNYTSRPMPITFAAANIFLQQANERFYRDPVKAPQFVLYQSGGIDNRLSLQDDALAKQALLDHYRPVLSERGLLLLKRVDGGIATGRDGPVIREQEVRFGETVSLNDLPSVPLWLEVSVRHSFAGKLMGIIYKPPRCTIGLQNEGEDRIRSFTFVSAMGKCGFLLTPELESVDDMLRFYAAGQASEKPGNRVARIVFMRRDIDAPFFKDTIYLRWKQAVPADGIQNVTRRRSTLDYGKPWPGGDARPPFS